MFGSSFFLVQSCSTMAVPAPCILAVNQNGLNFLSTETHVSGSAWPHPPLPTGTSSSTAHTCVTLGEALPPSSSPGTMTQAVVQEKQVKHAGLQNLCGSARASAKKLFLWVWRLDDQDQGATRVGFL